MKKNNRIFGTANTARPFCDGRSDLMLLERKKKSKK
jgi:hypothetical protein